MKNIPEDNLAYPGLIKLATNEGSGFRLNSGSKIYFITAKHVLFSKDGTLKALEATVFCQTKSTRSGKLTSYHIDLGYLQTTGNLFFHKDRDVAAFVIENVSLEKNKKHFTAQTIPGVSLLKAQTSATVNVAKSSVSFIADVCIANDVYLYGYPSSLSLRESPQFDYNVPLLRKGIIAGLNRKKGTLILDCPVYPGNSGGPIIEVRKHPQGDIHYVVGVVSQFVPYETKWVNSGNNLSNSNWENSGYSVAVAMDAVFEMLNIKV